jgi:2-dehydropantoate 2-reductase
MMTIMKKIKICIVGTGAMGSVYAGLLGLAGNDVWAFDTWVEHMDAIRRKGLRIEGISGDHTVSIDATTNINDIGVCDLVVIATKAMDVIPAAQSAMELLDQNTVVLTIQNGLGSSDRVADILGREKVIAGIAGGFGASIKSAGHVHHTGMDFVHLGELNGPVTARLEEIAAIWRHAGFNVKTFDNFQQLLWEKLICNVCYSATCTLTEMTLGEVMADENAWRIASGCASEAYKVAKAKGIQIDFDDPVDYVRKFGSKIPHARPSMLLDHLAGRPGEIDVINGAIPREGEKVGIPTPYNTIVSALVRARESHRGLR